MKRNNNIILILFLLLIISGTILYLFKSKESSNQFPTDNKKAQQNIKESETKNSEEQREKGIKNSPYNLQRQRANVREVKSERATALSSDQQTSGSSDMQKIHGYVLSEDEKPIKDAEITAIVVEDIMRRIIGGTEGKTYTSSDGYYEIELPTGKLYLLLAKSEGFSASQQFIMPNRMRRTRDIEINFKLSVESSISGIVLDENKKPIQGALISPFFQNQSDPQNFPNMQDFMGQFGPPGGQFGQMGRQFSPPDEMGQPGQSRQSGQPGQTTRQDDRGRNNQQPPQGAQVPQDRSNRDNRWNRFQFSALIPPEMLAVESDTEGKFIIHSLSKGLYSLAVRKTGYSPIIKPDVPAPSKNVEIILKKGEGCIIAGNVFLASKGEPCEDAVVKISSIPFTVKPLELKTDKEGAFQFKNLFPGIYNIWAEKGDMKSMPHPAIDLNETPNKIDVILNIFGGWNISGRAFEQDGLKTIQGVNVTLRENFRGEGVSTITDEAGYYYFNGIFSQRVIIMAQKEGYYSLGEEGSVGPITLTLPSDKPEKNNVDITMVRGVKISGKVITLSDGSPISGARVSFLGDQNRRFGRAESFSTNIEGEFSGYTQTNTRLILTASHEKYAEASTNPITVTDQPVIGIEIKMGGGGNIIGNVVDNENEPVANARVVGNGQSASIGDGRGAGAMRWTNSDDEGKFKIEKVPAGEFSITASAQGYDNSKRVSVKVEEGKDSENVVLTLGNAHFLEGTVKDNTGSPAVGIMVYVDPERGGGGRFRQRSVNTDDKGKFRFDSLRSGKYTVWADNGTLKSKRLEVESDTSGIELVIDLDEATLSGRVIDNSTKNPVEKFTIRAPGARREYGSFNNAAGEFEIQGLTRGNSYRFLIESEGFVSTLSPEVKIPLQDSPEPVVFEIGAGGSIFGTVKFSEDKKPVKGAKITKTFQGISQRGSNEQIGFTNQEGNFLFEGQSPGEYIIKATYGRYPEVSISCKVINDGVTDVGTMFLVNGGNIEGFIFDKGKPVKPMAGVVVRISSIKLASQIIMTYITGEDGRYFFEDLPRTQFIIVPQTNGFIEKKVSIKAGQTIRVDFTRGK